MPSPSVYFKGYACFHDWCGFDEIKPINVIIGRNNVGKSKLVDLAVEFYSRTKQGLLDDPSFQVSLTLSDAELQVVFENAWSSGLGFSKLGWRLSGEELVCSFKFSNGKIEHLMSLQLPVATPQELEGIPDIDERRRNALFHYLANTIGGWMTYNCFRIYADRDIRQEIRSESSYKLRPNGEGATRLIAETLNFVGQKRPLIRHDVKNALNAILAEDGQFTDILTQEWAGNYEVYLQIGEKDIVPLSACGSGLKTIILVLLNMLTVDLQRSGESPPDPSTTLFAFEELENNLHPSLLRRLLAYIRDFVRQHNSMLFLTTHSSVVLDFFAREEDAQIIRVRHDGTSARTETIKTHFESLNVLDELGAKPSDLLQANGLIWVEGPSDRILINRWIELIDPMLVEGIHYQIVFYGGSLLARLDVADSQESTELVNLITVNRNAWIVMDSDRSAKRTRSKPRVKKIKENSMDTRIFPWVTEGKEIENYLPLAAIQQAYPLQQVHDQELRDPEPYEDFWPNTTNKGDCYYSKSTGRSSFDKVDFAREVAPYISLEMMHQRFDLFEKVEKLVASIHEWNDPKPAAKQE